MYDQEKLREAFPNAAIYKDPKVIDIFRSAKIESFLRDWIIKKKANSDGRIDDVQELSEYIASILPHKEDKDRLDDEARSNGETQPFLANISVHFNSNANYNSFEIPGLGYTFNKTIIEDYVWNRIKGELIGKPNGWGVVKLGYLPPEGNKKNGRFTLLDFKNFCPYRVNLDAFRRARAQYDDVEEWLDVLLGAIDYNADGFQCENWCSDDVWAAKHTMITRLLPFIEPRVNLFELAPQQTGKSYIFGKTSKYGWLAGGGSLSRAVLFADLRQGAKKKGLVTFNDFVAIDETKSLRFDDDLEMAGILKGYMEDGYVKVGNSKIEGDAGIVFLGNIDLNDMDDARDMLHDLPKVFQDSALLERIHGFIPGKRIPVLKPSMLMNGWALNSEYFTEIMHLLRSPAETLRFQSFVKELVEIKSQKNSESIRTINAVIRLCTAYLKLFFPHVTSKTIADGKFRRDFEKYCLRPAVRMQETVLSQLRCQDPKQFSQRESPTYIVR